MPPSVQSSNLWHAMSVHVRRLHLCLKQLARYSKAVVQSFVRSSAAKAGTMSDRMFGNGSQSIVQSQTKSESTYTNADPTGISWDLSSGSQQDYTPRLRLGPEGPSVMPSGVEMSFLLFSTNVRAKYDFAGCVMAAKGMEGNGQDASTAGRSERAEGPGAVSGAGWGVGTPQAGPSPVPGHEGAARVAENYFGAARNEGADQIRRHLQASSL